jgi:phospholipase/lecithinase/hemolysin
LISSENLEIFMSQFDSCSNRSYSDASRHNWRQDYHNRYQPFRRNRHPQNNPIAIESRNTLKVRNYEQIVIFGDSLSDTGNAFRASNGTVPPFPYFEGRFSNGPIWIDQLAPKLHLQPNQVLNFAFGGATTGRLNSGSQAANVKLPGLLDEVDAFSLTRPQGANPKALYVVFAGANDFLTLPPSLFQGLAVGNLQSFIGLYGAIVQSVRNIATAVTNLAVQGAGTIAVANLPNLGRLPITLQQGTSLIGTAYTIGFNLVLEKTLAQLENNLRARSLNVDIVQVDLFSAGEAVAKRPQEFGITNLTDPLIRQTNPTNPNGFFFWDDLHPTTKAHGFIADAFERSLTRPTGSRVVESSLEAAAGLLNNGAVRPIIQQLIAQVQPLLSTSTIQNLLNRQPLTV